MCGESSPFMAFFYSGLPRFYIHTYAHVMFILYIYIYTYIYSIPDNYMLVIASIPRYRLWSHPGWSLAAGERSLAFQTSMDWFKGKIFNRKNPIFHGKIYGFRFRFSLKPIHWKPRLRVFEAICLLGPLRGIPESNIAKMWGMGTWYSTRGFSFMISQQAVFENRHPPKILL